MEHPPLRCGKGLASNSSAGAISRFREVARTVYTSQLELAVVEYVSWFNHERLHESFGDVPPVEFEDLYVRQGVQLSNLS